ncbi:MAG: hypothetical protein WAN93_13440 [Solirubrobacteraceae bacterium]
MRSRLACWAFGDCGLKVAGRDEAGFRAGVAASARGVSFAGARRSTAGAERPFGRDCATVAELEDLVGGDAGDRGQGGRGQRRGRDLVDAESEHDQDGSQQRSTANA